MKYLHKYFSISFSFFSVGNLLVHLKTTSSIKHFMYDLPTYVALKYNKLSFLRKTIRKS